MLFAWVKDKIKAQQEVINSINTSNNEIAIIIKNLLFYTTSCFETPTKGVQKNEPIKNTPHRYHRIQLRIRKGFLRKQAWLLRYQRKLSSGAQGLEAGSVCG